MRAKDARRVFLALVYRAGVVEQRAEGAALDTHVYAENIFTQKVEEHSPGGKLGEGDAALVAGGRPRVLAQLRVRGERSRVRRQELRLVALDRRHHPAGDEVRRVLEQPDELVHHLGHLDGDAAPDQLAVRGHENRHARVALAQLVQQRGGVRMRALAVRAEGPVEEHCAQRGVEADDRLAVLERERPDDVAVARCQRGRDALGRSAEGRLEPGERVVDDQHARPQGARSGSQHRVTPSRSRPASSFRRPRTRSADHGCPPRSRGNARRRRART